MKKTPKTKEIEKLLKELIKKKKVIFLSASKLNARLNGFSQFHKPPHYDSDIKYSCVAISRALSNLERENFITIYSVNKSGDNKMYTVNGK